MPNAVDGGEPDQYLALKMATAALKTSLTSRLYNLNFVARFNRTFSIAVGIEYLRFRVNDFSRAYDFDPLLATNPAVLFPPPEPLSAKLNQSFTGDKAGANLALHYAAEDSGWRFGLSMRFLFRRLGVLQSEVGRRGCQRRVPSSV